MAEDKITEEWLKKADEDFGYASASLAEELEFFAQICFHFHQSVEKYLKAFIVSNKLDFRKIHDLLELLEICTKRNRELKSLKDKCAFLNMFYISTRYPVHWDSNFTKEDALEAMKAADTVRKKIKKEIRF